MNILEEFWYGNIELAEYDISSSKEYKELLQLISRNEDKLLSSLTMKRCGRRLLFAGRETRNGCRNSRKNKTVAKRKKIVEKNKK